MKTIFTIIIVFIALTTKSQVFAGMGFGPSGAEIQGGYLLGIVESSIRYKIPFYQTNIPTLLSINIGTKIIANKIYVTPSLGICSYKNKDFNNPDHWGDAKEIKAIKPNYRLELGKDLNVGSLFIATNYCNGIYAEIGLKCYIK